MFYALQKELGSNAALLTSWLLDGCKRWRSVRSQGYVIVANNGDIVRNAQSGSLDRIECTDRGEIIACEDCAGALSAFKKFHHSFIAHLLSGISRHLTGTISWTNNKFFIDGQIIFVESLEITLES